MDAVRTQLARVLPASHRLTDMHVFGILMALTLVLRAPFLTAPLGQDEGGYAFVASQWGSQSGELYGGQWVDRPPLLFALYAAAIAGGGEAGVRLLGCLLACLAVVACADAGRLLAGRTGMLWSGGLAAVLSSTAVVQSQTVNAELPAMAFTAVAVCLAIRAVYSSSAGRAAALGVMAGLASMAALLVKQSFFDGLIFASVFIASLAVSGAISRRRLTAIASGVLVGAIAGCGAVTAWAELAGPGIGPLVDALYGFRLEARSAIAAAPAAPESRAQFLIASSAGSGLLAILGFVVAGLMTLVAGSLRGRGDARVASACLAILAMGAYGLAAMYLGGNWWMHYLIQLIPMLAIGTGIAAAAASRGRHIKTLAWAQVGVAVLVVATLVFWLGAAANKPSMGAQRTAAVETGDWLREASAPGDSAFVTWGFANVLYRSGLQAAYPMSWSLPVRVRDPQLELLRKTLSGSQAPTWIVEWNKFDLWGLDPDGSLKQLISGRYQRVTSVCGKPVYRLRDAPPVSRPMPAPPTKSACGPAGSLVVFGRKLW